jgi:diguanylate cyclase (GGDEF)-like protein
MRATEQTLAEQLRITEREIAGRRRLYDLGDDDLGRLSDAKPVILRHADEIVERFYEWITADEEMAGIIGDAETLARVKTAQRIYMLRLFDGQCDLEYALSRLRIGMVHNRIGVTPKYYVAAMRRLGALLRARLEQAGPELAPTDPAACCASLDKLLAFDLTLVFETYINSLTGELRRRRRELKEYAASLEETVQARTRDLENLARLDSLTGLSNQRTLLDALRREVSRSRRQELVMSLAYIDLDGFKRVNDTRGHRQGDEVLRALARTLKETLRAEDHPARYGGDEFVVIMPQTRAEQAAEVCERIAKLFDAHKPPCEVTLSIGIVEFEAESSADADMLVQFADDAMYEAKQAPGHAIRIARREDAGTG